MSLFCAIHNLMPPSAKHTNPYNVISNDTNIYRGPARTPPGQRRNVDIDLGI